MTNMPWGPHGPEVPPHSVLPNPTAPSPAQSFPGADEAAASMAVGSGGGLGYIAANIIFSLFLVASLWIPLVCLYPLTALAGMLAGFGTFPLFLRVLPADGRDVAAVLAVAVGAAVVLKVNRREHRLAEHPEFRRIRHLVRLALLSVWAIPIIQLSTGTTAPSTTTRYVLSVISSPRALVAFLARPQNLAIWAATMVGLHFLLWSGEPVRRWWHRRLKFVALK